MYMLIALWRAVCYYFSSHVHVHVHPSHCYPPPTSQAQRLHEKKEHSTSDGVMDPKTRLMLFKMVDNEVLTEINGCVSTGKEACVFHAGGGW